MQINKFAINEKNIVLSYLFMPSETIFRFKQELIGSVSTNVRLEYIKDAFKILKTSPIVGRGGEAFRCLYKSVQTQNYTSTEVHSSFVQILIESGILGTAIIITFICINLIKFKFDENKIVYILFVLHSCFDLNFSFLISVIFFAIICANLNKEK